MYKVVDNFLEYETFKKIKNMFLDSSFPWYFNNYILADGVERSLFDFQFTHTFYKNFEVKSNFYKNISPLIEKIDPVSILKIKANLGTVSNDHVQGGFHIDFNVPCTTAVYYINNNNGYTLLESGDKIESVENRIVFFDSNIYHTGVSQTDTQVRCVINLNYIKDLHWRNNEN